MKKTNKLYITLICALLVSPVFADNYFKGRTDNRLQSENNHNIHAENWLQTETWLQNKAASERGKETLELEDPTVPLGDGVPVLLLLGVVYGVSVFRKNRKN